MKQLIKKYSILLISALIITRLFTVIITIIWPDILTKENFDGSTTTYSSGYIAEILEYIVNIIFIALIATELKRQKIKSTPILIVTFFSSFVGVLFLLLFSAQRNLISKPNNQ